MAAFILGSALPACSSATSDGGGEASPSGENAGASDLTTGCSSRCDALATRCGQDPSSACPQLCADITEAKLSCIEAARCDARAVERCKEAPSGSSNSTSGGASTGSGSGTSSGKSAKSPGDACTCPVTGGSFYKSCEGTSSACFKLGLTCVASAKDGKGTCAIMCDESDDGKQGSCPAGKTCASSGHEAYAGSFHFTCQ